MTRLPGSGKRWVVASAIFASVLTSAIVSSVLTLSIIQRHQDSNLESSILDDFFQPRQQRKYGEENGSSAEDGRKTLRARSSDGDGLPEDRALQEAEKVVRAWSGKGDGSGEPEKPRVTVVVLVTTRAGSRDRRDILRPQFKKNLQLLRNKMGVQAVQSVVIKFLIGNDTGSVTDLESSQFKDMVYLDVPDSDPDGSLGGRPSATTLKVMHGIAWAVEHYRFDYLFRVGDDAYLRIDHFRALVDSGRFPREKLLLGYIVYGHNVTGLRVPYPSGMGFVLTYDICAWITMSSKFDLLLDTWPEDAIVGRWLSAIKVQEVHYIEGFHDYEWHMCGADSIVIHKLPPNAWTRIDENGLLSCWG